MTDDRTGQALPRWTIEVTPESVCRWYVGRDGRLPDHIPVHGDEVPLTYLFFLRSQPAAGISIHTVLGRDPDRGLFGGARYHRHRGVQVGDTLTATAAIEDRKTVVGKSGDRVISTLVTRWIAAGKPAVTEAVQMVDLPPGPLAPPAIGPPANRELEEVGCPLSFSRTQIAWLAVETGDWNPLHFDSVYARMRRFADTVVPGTLIAPVAERILRELIGAPLASLELRFRAPTYPGEEIRILAGCEDGGLWKFEVVGKGQVRALGQARAVAS